MRRSLSGTLLQADPRLTAMVRATRRITPRPKRQSTPTVKVGRSSSPSGSRSAGESSESFKFARAFAPGSFGGYVSGDSAISTSRLRRVVAPPSVVKDSPHTADGACGRFLRAEGVAPRAGGISLVHFEGSVEHRPQLPDVRGRTGVDPQPRGGPAPIEVGRLELGCATDYAPIPLTDFSR